MKIGSSVISGVNYVPEYDGTAEGAEDTQRTQRGQGRNRPDDLGRREDKENERGVRTTARRTTTDDRGDEGHGGGDEVIFLCDLCRTSATLCDISSRGTGGQSRAERGPIVFRMKSKTVRR
jgi:hypothetical protein